MHHDASPTNPSQLIELLGLAPLQEEGGYYRETYRAAVMIADAGLSPQAAGRGSRCAATCILYMLTANTHSALHVLTSDEIYHFYRGDPVELTMIEPTGSLRHVILGPVVEENQRCQFVVPAGVWQGARLTGGGSWALMGTTVTPGFEFADCRIADSSLCDSFPQHASIIERLLRRNGSVVGEAG